jgi:hypothetical protein
MTKMELRPLTKPSEFERYELEDEKLKKGREVGGLKGFASNLGLSTSNL